MSAVSGRLELYPPIEPYDRGMLDVGDGNLVAWEVSGTSRGKPAVLLHGGPGQGCAPNMRRGFDPSRYRIATWRTGRESSPRVAT